MSLDEVRRQGVQRSNLTSPQARVRASPLAQHKLRCVMLEVRQRMPPLKCFCANLDVYRFGVESPSGFFCPFAENVERTASPRFTPLTDDNRNRKSSTSASTSLTR